jgi:hypothetical protein
MITAHRPRGTDREPPPIEEPSAGQLRRPIPNERLERLLDEALEATFPASDPLALYRGKD